MSLPRSPLLVSRSTFSVSSELHAGCLFDIIADPTEHVDLAEQMPEVVDRMHARMVALQPTVYDPDRGPIDMDGACAALGRNRGFWTPWLNLSGHA